jgi:ribonuclease HI
MSSESKVFVGFTGSASRHTRRLASAACVIFTPEGLFVSSGGIYSADATKNVIEYSAVIEFLCDCLLHGICHLLVYLDAQLVVSQLNVFYHFYDPTLH